MNGCERLWHSVKLKSSKGGEAEFSAVGDDVVLDLHGLLHLALPLLLLHLLHVGH